MVGIRQEEQDRQSGKRAWEGAFQVAFFSFLQHLDMLSYVSLRFKKYLLIGVEGSGFIRMHSEVTRLLFNKRVKPHVPASPRKKMALPSGGPQKATGLCAPSCEAATHPHRSPLAMLVSELVGGRKGQRALGIESDGKRPTRFHRSL